MGEVKPENVDGNAFKDYVYFLENQKNFKSSDKKAIQQKLEII